MQKVIDFVALVVDLVEEEEEEDLEVESIWRRKKIDGRKEREFGGRSGKKIIKKFLFL